MGVDAEPSEQELRDVVMSLHAADETANLLGGLQILIVCVHISQSVLS